jgi:hypothetical protein
MAGPGMLVRLSDESFRNSAFEAEVIGWMDFYRRSSDQRNCANAGINDHDRPIPDSDRYHIRFRVGFEQCS